MIVQVWQKRRAEKPPIPQLHQVLVGINPTPTNKPMHMLERRPPNPRTKTQKKVLAKCLNSSVYYTLAGDRMKAPPTPRPRRNPPNRQKEVYSFTIPPEIMEVVDLLVEYGAYESRSEVVREALIRYLGDVEVAIRLQEKARKKARKHSKKLAKNPLLAIAEIYRLMGQIMQEEAESYPRYPMDVIDRVAALFRENVVGPEIADRIKILRKEYLQKTIRRMVKKDRSISQGSEAPPTPEPEDTSRR